MSTYDAKEALAQVIAEELLGGREDAVPTAIILASHIEMLIEEIVEEATGARP